MDDGDHAQTFEALDLWAAMSRMRPAAGRNDGGNCLACGDDIPAGRRRAIPHCELCVECQERLERGMGR